MPSPVASHHPLLLHTVVSSPTRFPWMSYFNSFGVNKAGARETAQQLRAHVALSEDPGWIPATHTAAYTICNSNSRGFKVVFGLHGHEAHT